MSPPGAPRVVAVRMGLGHLRAARPLATALGVPLERADEEPLATAAEARLWAATTELYEGLSRRAAEGGAAGALLGHLTAIPAPGEGRPAPDAAARAHDAALAAGLCARLVGQLGGAPLLTTFYTPALAAARLGHPAVCVVTDLDCARVWAPAGPAPACLRYAAPDEAVARRLGEYGVPAAQVEVTGFPLPPALVDGAEAATEARRRRLLAGEPLRVVAAVGGAGAQLDRVRALVRGALPALAAGEVELRLFLGLRVELAEQLRGELADALAARPGRASGPLELSAAPGFEAHAVSFEAALAEADVLWTKPSELSFYAALGLPLCLAPAVGVQEERNRAALAARGLALDAAAPADTVPALLAARAELARLAEGGLGALSRAGTARIVGLFEGARADRPGSGGAAPG